MINFGPYGKTLTALIVGLIGWATLVVHSASAPITADEWIQFVTVLATALGVFGVANAAKSA